MVLELSYQVLSSTATRVSIEMGQGAEARTAIDVTQTLSGQAGKGWQTGLIKLSCFKEQGLDMSSIANPLFIISDGPLQLQLESVRIVDNPGDATCELG